MYIDFQKLKAKGFIVSFKKENNSKVGSEPIGLTIYPSEKTDSIISDVAYSLKDAAYLTDKDKDDMVEAFAKEIQKRQIFNCL